MRSERKLLRRLNRAIAQRRNDKVTRIVRGYTSLVSTDDLVIEALTAERAACLARLTPAHPVFSLVPKAAIA